MFVLPSFFESLPPVELEALASGCRVVATDLPGITEISGGIDASFLDRVPTPRLLKVDQPFEEDQDCFETHLKNAMHRQMRCAMEHPQVDLSHIADRMAAFSWNGIFAKVQSVQRKVFP